VPQDESVFAFKFQGFFIIVKSNWTKVVNMAKNFPFQGGIEPYGQITEGHGP
jgi:hypothetical protein